MEKQNNKKEKFAMVMFLDRTFSKVRKEEVRQTIEDNPGAQVVSWDFGGGEQ